MLIYVSIAGIIALIILVIITVIIIPDRRKRVVQETSIQLKNLIKLNSQYNFDWNVQRQYQFGIYLQSKAKYDRYELIDLFDETITARYSELMRVANVISQNRRIYYQYSQELSNLNSEITQKQAKLLHIPYDKYIKIEQNLFLEQQIKPIINCSIICIASYTSPQGRNHYSKEAIYSIDQVPQRYKILQQKIVVQNSEKERRKRARSQMSDKLRYTILKRDGFRCKLCGRTADDGVKLHVDHIIPVSKGGESVPENLRTLCEDCNLGKSDEIE